MFKLKSETISQVVLLSGFLGAGKTTLLKRILSWPTERADTVVIVNEFGDAGIDGLLLKESNTDMVELSSGCICCTLSGDFKQALTRAWNRFHPSRILIEASGVADPAVVLPVFNTPEIADHITLSKIITVVDVDFWDAREVFGELFYSQLATADLILLNKIDLIEHPQIPVLLYEIHETFAGCHVIPTYHCGVDPETLWMTPKARNIELEPIRYFEHHDNPHLHESIENALKAKTPTSQSNWLTFSYVSEQPTDETTFRKFVDELPYELIRMKGLIRFPDRTEMVNYVAGKCEYTSWDGESQTRLVFIGWGVDRDSILDRWPPSN